MLTLADVHVSLCSMFLLFVMLFLKTLSHGSRSSLSPVSANNTVGCAWRLCLFRGHFTGGLGVFIKQQPY